jgi:hypothetical protein
LISPETREREREGERERERDEGRRKLPPGIVTTSYSCTVFIVNVIFPAPMVH